MVRNLEGEDDFSRGIVDRLDGNIETKGGQIGEVYSDQCKRDTRAGKTVRK